MRRLIATALLALLARPAAAQVTVDFTPKAGVYVPVEHFSDAGVITRHQTQFAIGGRLGLWLSPSLGLEGTVDYSEPSINTLVNGVNVGSVPANIFAASLRPTVKLSSRNGVTALVLSAGGGIVSQGGQFAAGLRGKTDLAPAAGVGLLVRLTRVVDARFDVDGYTYTPTLTDVTGAAITGRRQYDLFIAFGLRGQFGRF
jgi:hypothetical protein